MKQTIYEDMGTGRRYKQIDGQYQEIDTLEEHKYSSKRVSHGYMYQITADHWLWVQGIQESELEKEILISITGQPI